MSFGGILAQALAGGTAAIGKQAGDDIEAQRKADLMRQQADIEEQMRMRLSEFSEKQRRSGVLWETSGEGGAAKREYRKGELADASAADIDKARGMIPVQQEAARAKADTEKAITKEQAADPIYLGAVAKIKLADPEVAARIAASRASAGASAASAAESRERTEGLKLNNADKRTLDKLYADASTILADAGISDEERAKRYGKVQTQIVLMKSKNGQAPGRDPELDTQTVTEEKINPDGTTTKVVRKEVRKPGNSTGEKYPVPPPEAVEDVRKNPALKSAFYAKYGQENADKALGGGGGKPGGMAPGAARAATTDDSNDRTIRRVGTGYGTGYFRYAGQNYPSQQAAEAAKAKWDGISADDYFKTPD